MKTTIKRPLVGTIKTLLLGVAALSFSLPAMAQENDANNWQVGDTVIINREHTTYLTGEKLSSWVYDYRHIIRQVGGVRFPQGIWLRDINSWIAPEALEPATYRAPHAEENLAKPVFHDEKPATKQPQTPPVATPEPPAPVAEETEPLPVQPEPLPVQQEPLPAEETAAAPHDSLFRMTPHHRFSVGVRGGVASLMHQTDVMGKWRPGFDGLLDLQYAYYAGCKEGKKVNLGFITGVSVGWAQSPLRAGIDTAYTVSTSDGNIDYTVSAQQVSENDGQLQLEIPVMFSLLTEKGLFFNVGPKLVLPVYRHYSQKITAPDINAYFPEEGVNVSNEVITGRLTDNQLNSKGKWNGSKLNLMLTAELGYEWQLRCGNALGLGVYANYSVYDLYKNDTSNRSLINVTPPSSDAPALVNILSATDTYTRGLGYFDCGVKLIYHFSFPK